MHQEKRETEKRELKNQKTPTLRNLRIETVRYSMSFFYLFLLSLSLFLNLTTALRNILLLLYLLLCSKTVLFSGRRCFVFLFAVCMAALKRMR